MRAANPQNVRYFNLYHCKVPHLPVRNRPVVELQNGAVSVNSKSNKVTIKRSILETERF